MLFVGACLMPQYGDLDELTVHFTQLLEDNMHAYKELYQKEKNENEENKKELENLKSENKTTIEEASSLREKLEELKIAKEKELDDIRAKLNEEKNRSIDKEKQCQNLIKENKKLQSKYEAAKKHNHILLDKNSRIHSAMEELEDTQEKVSQLKECIQKTKINFEQISQEFVQKFQLLKQKVDENIMLKIKANQDCSVLMLECNELTRKLNAVLYENRCLRDN